MVIITGNNELERALCANSASIQTIINYGATTFCPQAYTAANSADPNVWQLGLDEMANNVKPARNSKEQMEKKFVRTDSFHITLHREMLKLLIKSKAKSAVESVRRKEFRGIIGNPINDVFTTGYHAAMESIEDSSYSFVENDINDMIYPEV